jgi:hypothetical protein
MQGLMITGAPPVGRNSMAQGFNASPNNGVAGKQYLSEGDIEAFVQAIFGESAEPFLRDAASCVSWVKMSRRCWSTSRPASR